MISMMPLRAISFFFFFLQLSALVESLKIFLKTLLQIQNFELFVSVCHSWRRRAEADMRFLCYISPAVDKLKGCEGWDVTFDGI